MASVTVDYADPLSSAEFAVLDTDRIAAITQRHKMLLDLLEQEHYDAVLLQDPCNVAWFCAGAMPALGGISPGTPAVFVTTHARVLLCQNTETLELFEHRLSGLGFQVKERPWFEDRHTLHADLTRGRRVGSDTGFNGTEDLSLRLRMMRLPLDDYDQQRLKIAGKVTAHAVEATSRGLKAGRTEAELAGELAHRLMKHGAEPVRLQVLADGRGRRYRHWTYSDAPINRYCTLFAMARYGGLYVGCSRTVALGPTTEDLDRAYDQASLVLATAMYFSQHDWELFEVWNRLKRIYEKFEAIDEWRLAEQGTVIEYDFGQVPVVPTSEFRLSDGVPLLWRPASGPALVSDTVLTTSRGPQLITGARDWPALEISVKGQMLKLPGILSLVGR